MRISALRTTAAALTLATAALAAGPATAATPRPAPAPYNAVEDLQHMADGYGRIIGPGGQLANARYLPALVQQSDATSTAQMLAQVADPTRLALTPAMAVPGWNVGNPLRASWPGTRGRRTSVAFTNRFGAKLRARLYRPLPGAHDPYTGAPLRAPYPGVVITPGSVGGSGGMYEWLAEDLAERGYLVMVFDVQGEGTSETLPHTDSPFPFCNPFGAVQGDAALGTREQTPCPGTPFQQLANFTTGTVDAIDFFTSTPAHHYANPGSTGTTVDAFNPWWRAWDRRPLAHPTAPGRRTRLAIIGHSMGALAVSYVQGYDKRVATAIALDKLSGGTSWAGQMQGPVHPVVPALGLQAEYGFGVTPWQLSGTSSLTPTPSPEGPDPTRERRTGFDAWRHAGVDSMLVVPRSATHLDFTDVPLVLPASRYGQDLVSVYAQRWLARYLEGVRRPGPLLARSFRYLEPEGAGEWRPTTLDRRALLSDRYCSAYAFGHGSERRVDLDIRDVGC